MSGVLLGLEHVSVRFRSHRQTVNALDDVTIDWIAGETLGVVGESGSGKSTMARVLMGVQPLTAGRLLLDGEEVSREADLRRLRQRVQLIFQDPYQSLNPRLRVRTIVREPLVVQRVPRVEHDTRIARALADVGLDPARFADRYPHQLSGGQRQRVAIAAALVLEPDGLICDEPVSMLDVSVRAQVLEVLRRLREERGLSLLFITHDLSLAWSICDRVAVVYHGEVVELGATDDVIGNPRHPYTTALVEAVPRIDPDVHLWAATEDDAERRRNA